MFPENINTFIDLFCGGCNVGINVKSNKMYCNDSCFEVIKLFNYLYLTSIENQLELIDKIIKKYSLTKTNEDGFYKLRKDYNFKSRHSLIFYMLICHAFNYQIRFNKSHMYNMPFGKNRSSFNSNLRKNFIAFVTELHKKRNCIYKQFF